MPCILFYTFLYMWNLIVKKKKKKVWNWPNNLIYTTTHVFLYYDGIFDSVLIRKNGSVKKVVTAQNILFLPNFLIWKFYRKVAICPKLCGNFAFPQNFYTKKLVKLRYFMPSVLPWFTQWQPSWNSRYPKIDCTEDFFKKLLNIRKGCHKLLNRNKQFC